MKRRRSTRMKFSDEYTRDDLIYINHISFATSMIMFVLALIAKVVGII